MHEHHCLAAIQFLEGGRERWVAQPFVPVAGHQRDSVGLQRVERVFDFLQAGVLVRQGQRRQMPEAARMILHHFRGEFVVFVHQRSRRVVIAQDHAAHRNRQQPGRNSALVHFLHGHVGRPAAQRRIRTRISSGRIGEPRGALQVRRRNHMESARRCEKVFPARRSSEPVRLSANSVPRLRPIPSSHSSQKRAPRASPSPVPAMIVSHSSIPPLRANYSGTFSRCPFLFARPFNPVWQVWRIRLALPLSEALAKPRPPAPRVILASSA